jgi:hypothetical protein
LEEGAHPTTERSRQERTAPDKPKCAKWPNAEEQPEPQQRSIDPDGQSRQRAPPLEEAVQAKKELPAIRASPPR